MKLLILGGTQFYGRHLVEAALTAGYQVTLFNRGQTNPDLYPEVERFTGDRDGNLEVLKGRSWDAVIDPSGYLPGIVRQSAELLADAVEHYTFISSISVFSDFSEIGITEDSPVATLEDESVEEVTPETYGALKALCEQTVETALPGRTLVIRPGLIVGPYDPTDRFTYWPWRVAQGGRVLAPGDGSSPAQLIDARDLAEWNLRLVEQRVTGIYNATGPDKALTLKDLLESNREVSGSDAEFVWADAEFLSEHEIAAWSDMPMWIDGEDFAGFSQVDVSKALAARLTFLPLSDTIRDTLAWANTRPADHEWKAGLSKEREGELLASIKG
ncbi:MAG: NAD-dependent epimerase/dehydratase family protein [Chloroflexi bacterium]|nr:MAG: NAD-dependent epimerase/dehydratase family protein [Chloroflexota bacterium]MBL1193057.1 SDR family oxidoreductase [Chloroflexota bacterium]NOH10350.1 SDR family oxidoreductase [Chloroflexota bacterium]